MGLFKALVKSGMRSANESKHKKNLEKSGNVAYNQVGKKMKQAKRKGQFINGSSLYKENKNKVIQQENTRYKLTEKFIDDL